jgi:hypothetical protein
MADYVLARKSRNIASSMVHVFLNLLLGVGAVVVTVLSNSPVLGIILVLASKWRIFAVRARYWALNIKSNLADLIVGISVVLLAYFAGPEFLPVDFVLMAFYSIWLLFIKPLSSETAAMVQSLITAFIGITASVIATSGLDSIVIVLLVFLIGYTTSRHILSQSEDKDFVFTTLICGLLFAEITWLCQSWSIIYTFGTSGIKIPQLAIILTIFLYVYNYARQAMIRYQEDFRFRQILGPVIFGVVLIAVIVLGFSNPIFNV